MLKNYLLVAFRNLLRHRSFSLLNIFGLTVGLTCGILIFLWVQDERSYDAFNTNAKKIYRITGSETGVDLAVLPTPSAKALQSEMPEIERATSVKSSQGLFIVGNRSFDEKKVLYTDSNFLRMFTYPLEKGDLQTALSQPDCIVITEDIAIKYFGTRDAIGKVIQVNNNIVATNLTVTGILKNPPGNSQLQFDILLPVQLYEKTIDYDGSWGNYDVYTYIELKDLVKTSKASLDKKITALIRKYQGLESKSASTSEFRVQPLTDVHLYSGRLLLDVEGQGNIQHVRIFSLIALFILAIACINFMNLATALSRQRAKEVGLRKVIGAMRWQLIIQFLGESVLLSLIALLLSLGIAYLLLPWFNSISYKHLTLDFINTKNLGFFIGVALITGIIAGSYPALFLSSFKPSQVLKGKIEALAKGLSLRNGLVVIQFTISVVLIISTMVVYTQLQYIRDRNIGFDKENLLYVQMPQTGDLVNNTQALKATLAETTGLSDYSIISHLPTYLTTGTSQIKWTGKDPAFEVVVPHLSVDNNFTRIFNMKMLSGRFFSEAFKGDAKNYVINEAALKMMHMDASAAIGQLLEMNGRQGEIIGVVKDFNFKPVQQAIEPLVLKPNTSGGYLIVRTQPGTLKQTMSRLQAVFEKVYPKSPFSCNFLDKDIDRLYLAEQQMGKLFNIFAVLSVIVSCLGLFGLAAFTAQRRIKEIGIRKVLGATEAGIVAMLSKDFIRLVIVSLIFAFPVAAWLMNKWLQNFVYRIELSWWMFAATGALAVFIAFITVSYQSFRAAMSNPVKSLRSE